MVGSDWYGWKWSVSSGTDFMTFFKEFLLKGLEPKFCMPLNILRTESNILCWVRSGFGPELFSGLDLYF